MSNFEDYEAIHSGEDAVPMPVDSLIKHRHNTVESTQSELQDLRSMDLERYFEREPDELPDPEHDFVNDQPW